MKREFIFLGIILLLAAFLRFFQIGNIPFGITNDEASYIYSAYSIWETGKGLDGTVLPLSFNVDSSNSPVPVYISSPFVGLLGVSSASGRLPYVLLGIASVLLVYLIVKKLLENPTIALLSAGVLAVSPWHVFVSRTAYDTVSAMFFFLLGIYIFVLNYKKGNILWSLPAFVLAFYSYHATKLFFLFLLPVLAIAAWPYLKQRKKQLTLFILGYVFIVLSFLFVIQISHVTRQNDALLSYNDQKAFDAVIQERNNNSSPNWMKMIFNNKPLYFLRVIRENYLETFSTNFLFLYGEVGSSAATLGVYNRGVMYWFELPLLLFGLYFLFAKEKNFGKRFILVGLLLAPLTSTFVTGKSYVLRDLVLSAFLSIVVACGIYFLISFSKNKKIVSYLVIGFILLLYVFHISSFLYQYYYRYPVYGAEAWNRGDRDLAVAIKENTKNYDEILLVNAANIFSTQYAIEAAIDPIIVQKNWRKYPKKIGNLTMIDKCLPSEKITALQKTQRKILYITSTACTTIAPLKFTINDLGLPQNIIWQAYKL